MMNNRPSPPVWKWYVAYCAFMALLYFVLAVLSFVSLSQWSEQLEMKPGEAEFFGLLIGGVSALLVVPFAAAPFLPKRSWAWVYGLVLVCVGMTSPCLLPATIPIILNWFKPETKEFFGRTE